MALKRPVMIVQEQWEVPDGVLGNLGAFRAWTLSPDFPRRGRIDFLQGNIEVDMSPEDLQHHGAPKTKLTAYILGVVEADDLGQVFSDCSRLVHAPVGLSCEPDIVFVSWDALDRGRVRYVKSSTDKLMEIEGAATLAVEIVSDSSVQKDLKRLPKLYAAAGVEELWILDARGVKLRFDVMHLHNGQWQTSPVDAAGFQQSRVLSRRLRLRRAPGRRPDTWRYFVDESSG